MSFIVPARSQRAETRDCLDSILFALRSQSLDHVCEFVLIDDDSDPAEGITALFQNFRAACQRPVHITRFKKRQHYTGVFAYGLSKARGHNVFFISNDMFVTSAWLRSILATAALDPSFGIVRGTAEYVDSHPEHCVVPPYQARSPQDWIEFSEFIARSIGLVHTVDQLLSGDAVLIKRSLLDRIGTFDRRYYGYFGDLDFGIRAQRAGFKLVCAKGAWLRHHGAGYVRAEMAASQESQEQSFTRRMQVVQAAYSLFRQKWDPALPENYTNSDAINFDKIRKAQKPKGFDHIEFMKDDPALLDIL
jgi:GT2 family glycosyltransferase